MQREMSPKHMKQITSYPFKELQGIRFVWPVACWVNIEILYFKTHRAYRQK